MTSIQLLSKTRRITRNAFGQNKDRCTKTLEEIPESHLSVFCLSLDLPQLFHGEQTPARLQSNAHIQERNAHKTEPQVIIIIMTNRMRCYKQRASATTREKKLLTTAVSNVHVLRDNFKMKTF